MRVHDARGVAEGASGRNGGFALSGGSARYDVARETYGAERAKAYWLWTEEKLDRLAELAGDALRRTGSYRLAADEEERDAIRLEYEALREDGIAAEWLDDVPGAAAGKFHGAIAHPRDGAIQPARLVRRLAARAAEAGAEFREHEPVEDVDALDADRVLVATDGYGHGLVSELDDLIWPTRGQVIVSEPLDERPVRPPALRAPRLRLLAAAPRRPHRARRLPRPLDHGRAHRRRGARRRRSSRRSRASSTSSPAARSR